MIRVSSVLLAAYVLASLWFAAFVYDRTLKTELRVLQENGTVRLSEAASRLRLQIDGFREQANFIAHTPSVTTAMAADDWLRVQDFLVNFSLTYGASQIDLVDRTGAVLASSSPKKSDKTPSKTLLQAAINERLGFEHAIEDQKRVIRLSRGVRLSNEQNDGAVILTVDIAELEFQWPVTPEPLIFYNQNAQAISSNRPELLLLSFGDGSEEGELDLRRNRTLAGFETWAFASRADAPQEALVLSKKMPLLLLNGQIIIDIASVLATARQRTGLAAALALVLGLVVAIAVQQRRRFALEAQQSATLEARVEERTKELRAAQDELVEASKLAALGRLSAGVSHELNQPLAAILNFSENARKFLERKQSNRIDENLSEISNQVQRINRIIGNLRAFARQESAPNERIDFNEVIKSALALVDDELASKRIEILLDLPEGSVFIVAGKVRLEQVIFNILTNAIDAMSDTPERRLSIEMTVVRDNATLIVRDTGPGIADPDRVFEPFYTTKDLGASKGLGMGLSLSFGIIQQFGGTLSCRNLSAGAEFKLSLPLMEKQDAE
ncbi:MAG: ATP-binding protein [Pseudomonadota bacterium]